MRGEVAAAVVVVVVEVEARQPPFSRGPSLLSGALTLLLLKIR